MAKLLTVLLIFVASNLTLQAQTVKQIIDRELPLIKSIPVVYTSSSDKLIKRYHKSHDEAYKKILRLDTLALAALINKISDTTSTPFYNDCLQTQYKTGDIAFCLINDIAPIVFNHLIFGGEWDLLTYECGFQSGTWEYLNSNRLKFQIQLREFLVSHKGKLWIQITKEKLNKQKREELLNQFLQ